MLDEFIKKADADAKVAAKSSGTNKNGTPDMILKANKQAAKDAQELKKKQEQDAKAAQIKADADSKKAASPTSTSRVTPHM